MGVCMCVCEYVYGCMYVCMCVCEYVYGCMGRYCGRCDILLQFEYPFLPPGCPISPPGCADVGSVWMAMNPIADEPRDAVVRLLTQRVSHPGGERLRV